MYKAEKKNISIYSLQFCHNFTISTFWSVYKAENKDVLTVAIIRLLKHKLNDIMFNKI